MKVILLCQSSLLLDEGLLRCLDGALELIVIRFIGSAPPRRHNVTPSCPLFLLVDTRMSSDHAITHVSPVSPLLPKTPRIAQKVRNILCLLPHVRTTILAILVHVLKLLQRLDDVDVVFEVQYDVLRPGVQEVIENGERLSDVSAHNEREI